MAASPCLIVPAAGHGTRMRSLTAPHGGAKELLPVAGRPAILHALAQGATAGCDRGVVVLRAGKEHLARLLDDPRAMDAAFPHYGPDCGLGCGAELERLRRQMDLRFTWQAQPLGECDAILTAREAADGRPLAIFYPDNIPSHPEAPAVCCQAAQMPEGTGVAQVCGLMAVTPELAPTLSDSGRVDLEPVPGAAETVASITHFLAKGPGPFTPRWPGELRTCGIYWADTTYFDWIERAAQTHAHGELTDGVVRRLMLQRAERFLGVALPGTVWDIGTPAGYAAACSGWETEAR